MLVMIMLIFRPDAAAGANASGHHVGTAPLADVRYADLQRNFQEEIRQRALSEAELKASIQELTQENRSIVKQISEMKGRYDAKLEATPTLTASNLIAFFGLVVTVLIWRLGRQLESRKLTIDMWEQFLTRFKDIGEARYVLTDPLNATPEDFSRVQAVRNWIDSVAALGCTTRILDANMIKAFGITRPLRDFMNDLSAAAEFVRVSRAAGAAVAVHLTYENEVNASETIEKFINTYQ